MRPAALRHGQVRARATAQRPADGRWRWRVEKVGTRKPTHIGVRWAHVEEMAAELEGRAPALTTRRALASWRDLLSAWSAARGKMAIAGSLAEETERTDRYAVQRLVPVLGQLALVETDLLSMEGVRDDLLGAGYSTGTVHLDLRVARKAWGWARRRKLLPVGGSFELPALRVVVGPRPTPSDEEVARVYARLDGWARVAFLVAAATGARPGELFALTWGAIDFSQGELVFSAKTTKTRREGRVPLLAQVVAQLELWKAEVRASGGLPVGEEPLLAGGTAQAFRRLLPQACAAAGVARFPPYGLRRHVVDALARAGVQAGVAAKITRHHPRVMLEKYQTVQTTDQREGAESAGLGASLLGVT
jgi:integrase